ncbi:MAG: zinc ribbon domain-containing protein [Candidatus Electryonea clarkiae]|nr:zinc ribbon domain-containing protein [Candidatus Electryonea clarkiae]MDP8285787.1 zinc ribbon domain-containing protein [Candidatus Electryonea clarkiae]
MPSYTYECKECSQRFDLFHSIVDTSSRFCPECGGLAQHVISGGVGLIFKGSGYYETDYKRKKNGLNGNEKSGGNGTGTKHHKQASSENKTPDKTEKKEKVDNKNGDDKKV